jgi:excisionase family DNA binding protein
MTALEQAIRSLITEEVAAAEKRLREGITYRDRTLSVEEAAVYISSLEDPISTKTLYAMCDRGEIPHRRVGRRIFFSTAALDRWGREQDRKNYKGWREETA